MMVSSYQIMSLINDNTFNSDCKWSSGLLILFSVCNIIPRKGKHWMSLIICFGQNNWLFWRSFFLQWWKSFFRFFPVRYFVEVKFKFFKQCSIINVFNILLDIFTKNVSKTIFFILVVCWTIVFKKTEQMMIIFNVLNE